MKREEAIMDLDIERNCEHYAPMTRADEIRSMTDKELAMALLYVLRKLKKERKKNEDSNNRTY